MRTAAETIRMILEDNKLHSQLMSQHSRVSGTDHQHLDIYARKSTVTDGKGRTVTEHEPKKVDGAIERHRKPLKDDAVIYRGLTKHPDTKTTTHQDITAKGPLSTTIDKKQALGYAAQGAKAVKGHSTHDFEAHSLKIKAKKGTKGVYLPGAHGAAESKEFLMHSGTTIRIHPNPKVEFKTHHHEYYENGNFHKQTARVKHHVWNAEIVHDGTKPKKGIGSY